MDDPVQRLDSAQRSRLSALITEVWTLLNDGTSRVVAIDLDGYSTVIAQSGCAASLSPREAEIVRLVSQGHPNKAIAEALDISPHTVASHLRRLFAKLDVRSRAELVACVALYQRIGIDSRTTIINGHNQVLK